MPTYKFKDKKTGSVKIVFMTISERTKYLEDNPHIEQMVHGAPMIVYGNMGSEIKIDGGFKEVLQKIADKHPLSPLGDRYAKKSIKQLKTEKVVKEHRKRNSKSQ